MERKTIVGLIAIAAVAMFAGCMGSTYQVEYSPSGYYSPFGSYQPLLLVNVSGPADDLAIILTDPEEDTHIKHISKDRMIDNFESVDVPMGKVESLSGGTYRLVVKTITPEKVVYEGEVKFKPAIVQIIDTDVKFDYEEKGGYFGVYYWLYGDCSITVKNDGELPVAISEALYITEGEDIKRKEITMREVLRSGEIRNIDRRFYIVGGEQKPSMPNHVKIVLYSSEGEVVASSETRI